MSVLNNFSNNPTQGGGLIYAKIWYYDICALTHNGWIKDKRREHIWVYTGFH